MDVERKALWALVLLLGLVALDQFALARKQTNRLDVLAYSLWGQRIEWVLENFQERFDELPADQ